jgi:pectate lyase
MGGGGANGGAGNGGTGGSGAGNGGTGGSAAGKGGTGGGGATGTLLFFDDFESGTSRWTSTPVGVWATTTDGSTVYAATAAPATSTARLASAGESTWTDVQVDARVKITSFAGTSSAYFAGVCARYQSSSTYACFALRSNGQVMFRVNGANTAASNPPGGAITAGTWYSIRVVAIGSNITAFVNGSEIASASRVASGAPAQGSIALFAPGTNAVFDDVRVTVP